MGLSLSAMVVHKPCPDSTHDTHPYAQRTHVDCLLDLLPSHAQETNFTLRLGLKLHLILWTLELAKSSCGLLITTGNNSWICLICSPVSNIRVNSKLYYSLYEMYSSTVWLYYDVGGGIVCHNAPISLKMQFSSMLARNVTVNIKPKSLKMFGGGSSSVCALARRLICVISFVWSSWMHSTPS